MYGKGLKFRCVFRKDEKLQCIFQFIIGPFSTDIKRKQNNKTMKLVKVGKPPNKFYSSEALFFCHVVENIRNINNDINRLGPYPGKR